MKGLCFLLVFLISLNILYSFSIKMSSFLSFDDDEYNNELEIDESDDTTDNFLGESLDDEDSKEDFSDITELDDDSDDSLADDLEETDGDEDADLDEEDDPVENFMEINMDADDDLDEMEGFEVKKDYGDVNDEEDFNEEEYINKIMSD